MLTDEVGGPAATDRESPGVTVKLAALVPVPPGVVTEMGPVDAAGGTTAVSFVSVPRPTMVAAAPLNRTAVALVNPDPLIVTWVPMVPDVGVKLEMVWATADTVPRPRKP